MLVRSRDTAAAGGRGAQATCRGPIRGRARPAAHHDRAGRGLASALTHARILLKANQGEAGPSWTDAAIGAALEVNPATVARVRMRYVAAGLDAAVYRTPPAGSYRRRLDGEQEARLVALTAAPHPRATSAGRCGCWPTGWWSCRWWSRCRTRRSARPCSNPAQAVADGSAGAAYPSRTPSSSGGWRTCSGSPPGPMTHAVRRSAWTRPAASCSARSPRPAQWRRAGQPDRSTRTSAAGWATCSWWPSRLLAGATSPVATGAPGSTGRTPIKDLVDVHYPDAEQIVLVQDNLNTHTPALLDAAFGPAEAKRLADKLELHYTPSTAAG
jgi:Winged helix-turn helix